MDFFKEGTIKFYAENKQLKSSGVFYNPIRKFDRSLNVLFLSSLNRSNLNGLELFSGSGVRGIRICAETKKFSSFDFNDIKSVAIISKNLRINKDHLNGMELCVHNENSKFYVSKKKYDYVDVDPFGSPVPYTEPALGFLSRKSILAVSATDTAALLGSAQRACLRKYGSLSLKTSYSNELGIRILIKRIAELSEDKGLHAKPLLFDFDGNFIRVYFSFSASSQGRIGYAYQCSKCPSRTLKRIEKCVYCGSKMTQIGPLWLDGIFSKTTVKNMLSFLENNATNLAEDRTSLHDYLFTLLAEKNIFSYYTTSELSSFFKKPEEKISKFSDRTILSSKGFRTKLSFGELAESLWS